ncbi:MAG: hypothetical protein Tsb0016_16430 [Sphingomonadales bacterium]
MRRGRAVAAALAGFLVLWLIVTMPLAVAWRWLAPDLPGLGFERATGTIWHGRFEGAHWRGADLGDADWRLSAWRLMLGRLAVRLHLEGGAVRGDALVLAAVFGSGGQLADTRIDIDLSRLPTLLPTAGWLRFEFGRAGFQAGECVVEDAVLDIRGFSIAALPGQAPWRAAETLGEMGCQAGRLVASLAARQGDGRLDLRADLAPDFGYRLRVGVGGVDPGMIPALEMAGFQQDGANYELVQEGGVAAIGRFQAP